MTNHIITKIQEAEKEFDEKFSLEFFSTEDWQYDYRETPSEIEFKTWQENATNGARTKKDMIKSFHLSTIISLLQAEIERMKGMKKDTRVINRATGGEALPGCAECGRQEECTCDVYNESLDEQIVYYQECVKLLEPNE